MAKLTVEIDTEANNEVVVKVDGELLELPHQLTLHISEGLVTGIAHFWQPENQLRYGKGEEGFKSPVLFDARDAQILTTWQSRQDRAVALLKKLPFVRRWLFELAPEPQRAPLPKEI